MPTTIKPVSPFYDNVTAPPLLGDHAEYLKSLLATEVLGPAGLDVTLAKVTAVNTSDPLVNHSRQSTPAPVFRFPSRSPKSDRRSTSPYAKRVTFQRATSAASEQTHSATDASSASDDSSDSESSLSTLSEDSKIPKPQGEPGRPGRGGYNLETALDWNHAVYLKFKKLTHRLVDEHLDTAKCASAQNPTLLKVVHDKATAAFPDLENYSNCWPVTDMVMMRLKYTSSRARRWEIEIAAGKAETAAGKAKRSRVRSHPSSITNIELIGIYPAEATNTSSESPSILPRRYYAWLCFTAVNLFIASDLAPDPAA
ncbi:hypothetical protein EDD17DRAFT_1771032 [Pisolithus thermaeus]|nr:hypothetical protein EDD17DRAFT_1771032 [Pisolithus thermaeus]